jgi:hypothetical protein
VEQRTPAIAAYLTQQRVAADYIFCKLLKARYEQVLIDESKLAQLGNRWRSGKRR